MKLCSHKWYLNRLVKIDSSFYPLEKYLGRRTKILHKCARGHKVRTAPDYVLEGRGCRICWQNKRKSGAHKRQSHKEYLKKLRYVTTKIIPLEKYKGQRIKTKHKCLVHNHVWSPTPSNLLNGHKCPKCKSCAISEYMKATDIEERNFKRRPYKIGNKIIQIQGYENFGIEYLLLFYNLRTWFFIKIFLLFSTVREQLRGNTMLISISQSIENW